MPADRFYHPHPLQVGNTLSLEAQENTHLVRVMRKSLGDTIEIVNGQGALAIARLIDLHKGTATLQIDSVEQKPPSSTRLILALALPRAPKLDLIVEKGTELGMDELWLFPGAYSEKKKIALPRLEKITASALKQCGRLFMPTITFFPSLNDCPLATPSYFGDTQKGAPPLLKVLQDSSSCCLFIGPEKGWSPAEITALKKRGATSACLHPNILRTETACLAALSLASAVFL
jgi:16S rRNA (uracil1498-N3)-methyltransferase